ncbi:hypothetical protein AAVH_38578 [Aphelenchoides avenae]|nr:hypothetical protein AAVH_38578 [Aphelenchus avenae]
MDATARALPKECPFCHDPFNITGNTRKIVGMCGHSVCAVCVPVCIDRDRATCPLCRQETSVPANGFGMRDTLETILAARAAASVQCSGCDEKFPSAKIFACKSCTHDAVVSVCGFCAMEEHRLHETVKLDKLATREEVDQAHKEIASYNKQLRLRVEGINSQFEQARLAIDRLVHDCQAGADNLQVVETSFVTKEETQRLIDESRKRAMNVVSHFDIV